MSVSLTGQLGEALRRRRAMREHEHTLRVNDSLAESSRALRREAQAYLNAGRPDLAEPYIAEARLFEAAMQHPQAS